MHAKKLGFSVLANDWQKYSATLTEAQLYFNAQPSFSGLNGTNPLAVLNDLPGERGRFAQYYGAGDSERLYFSKENARKIDACRNQIEAWHSNGSIDSAEQSWLTSCLLQATDRVANTASIYGAYLKKLKRSATKPLTLQPLAPGTGSVTGHTVSNGDILDLKLDKPAAVLYLDPPYNQRQYSANYHILETIAAWDLHRFEPRGITGLRPGNELQSPFCRSTTAAESMRTVLAQIPSQQVVLSYNSDGILSLQELESMLQNFYPHTETHKIEYPRFKADNESENRKLNSSTLYEYILIGKQKK